MQFGANETVDRVLDGRIKIIQKRKGYRFTEDTLHLCQFIRPMSPAKGIDLGTGCGIVAITLVVEGKVDHMVGLELQQELVSLAERNVALNGLEQLVEIKMADIRRVRELFGPGSFQLVVSNPPYREIGRGRLNPSLEKRIARHEWACTLQDLVKAADYLLAPDGVFGFCHLEQRWPEIQRGLKYFRMEVCRKEIIYGPGGKSTGLLLVEAVRAK